MKKNIKFLSILVVPILSLLPSFGYASFDKDLHYGITNNNDVRELQTFLTDQGIYAGPLNGNYFSQTKKAVAMFQDEEGILPTTGYFGTETRNDVNKLLDKGSEIDTRVTTETSTAVITDTTLQDVASTTKNLLSGFAILSDKYLNLESEVNQLTGITDTLSTQILSLQTSISTMQDAISSLGNRQSATPASAPIAPTIIPIQIIPKISTTTSKTTLPTTTTTPIIQSKTSTSTSLFTGKP